MCVMNQRGDIAYGGTYVGLLRSGVFQPQRISDNADLPAFLNDDVIAYQYGLNIQPIADVRTTDGQFLNNFGASNIYAGGNNWIINYGSTLYAKNGPTLSPANRASVGFDGSRAYQGQNYVGVFGDGINAPNEVATYIHRVDRNACMWTLGTKQVRFFNGLDYLTYNVNVPINYARIFYVGQKIFIIYNGDFLYIHDITDPTQGWRIDGPTYNADALVLSGQVKVAYSSTQGETDESINFTPIPLSTPMQKFPTTIVPPPPTGSKYSQKMWTACFFSLTKKYGITPESEYLGDCAMQNDETGIAELAAPRGLPIICGLESYDPRFENLTISFMVGDESGYRAATSNKYPIKPITYYLDNNDWPASCPSFIQKNKTWALINGYRKPTESTDQAIGRITSVLDRVASYRLPGMGILMEAYDHNGTAAIELAMQMYNAYDAWIRHYNLMMAFAFADRRPGGILNYPAIRPYVKAIFDMNPMRPTRNDYWSPSALDKSKVQQDVMAATGLSQDEKVYIIALIEKDK